LNFHLGLTYPNTLAKALELTSNFKSMSRERYSSHTSRDNAVYHLTKNTNPRRPTGQRNHGIMQSINYSNERPRKKKVQSSRDHSNDELKKEIICWKCHKKGHKMKECRVKDVKKSNFHAQWEEDHDVIIDEFLREMDQSDGEEVKEQVVERTNFMMKRVISEEVELTDHSEIILDNGAQVSMFRDESLLEDVHESTTRVHLQGGIHL
jgi:hypothetical protein